MKKAILIITVLLLFCFVGYYFRHNILNQTGVLEIKTEPTAIVIINGDQAGTTPLRKQFSPQDLMIKLLPQEGDQSTPIWQGEVRINNATLTLIRKFFSSDLKQNWGEILGFNKIPDKNFGAMAITSHPNKAIIKLDGEVKGYTPILLEKMPPGQHILELSLDNYENAVLGVNIQAGYQLNAEVKLKIKEITSSQNKNEEDEVISTPQITILDTPTGWLRVREGPGTSYNEIGQVKPGEKYPLIEEKDGWYKIKLENEEGWISARYAEKNEDSL